MRYWVFNEGMLDQALAVRVAELRRQGATEQQALDEAVAIKTFLVTSEALQGYAGDARKGTPR